MRIGLVIHPGRDASRAAASDVATALHDAGVEVVITSGGQPDDPIDGLTLCDPDGFADGLDIAVSLGGDGTFLRAAHLCRDASVPVLGVNLGRLGFLAEVERDELDTVLVDVVAGRWRTEPRAVVEVRVEGPDGTELGRGWALNEVAVDKTERHRLLLMDVHVDGALFAEYPADSLIVATATGSTAYALSAGGPLVSPRVEALLIVPVAPHSLFDRTFVAHPDEQVRVALRADQAPALVSCDGRSPLEAPAGSQVYVEGGGRPVLLARTGADGFPTLVRRKFGLH